MESHGIMLDYSNCRKISLHIISRIVCSIVIEYAHDEGETVRRLVHSVHERGVQVGPESYS